MIANDITSWFSANQTVSTVILFIAFFLLRTLSETMLRGSGGFVNTDRRRMISYAKNALVLLLLIGLVLIWAPALRTFALSVTAFLVALVLATKEIILCITGGILRTSTGSFSVGDWVRIGDKRGEVLHQSILSVTLQELEDNTVGNQFTGRTLTLPNSIFLTASVINENFFKKYVYHQITVTIEKDDDPALVARWLEEATIRATADSRDVAARYSALIEKRAGIDLPVIEPRLRYATSADGRPRISITVFIPTQQTEQLERDVMSEILAALYQHRKQSALEKPA